MTKSSPDLTAMIGHASFLRPSFQKPKLLLPRQDGSQILVPFGEVVRGEAEGAYTILFLQNGQRQCVCKPLGMVLETLQRRGLPAERTHRSHFVNLEHVTAVVPYQKQQYIVQLNGQDTVPVAKGRVKEFNAALGRVHVRV